MKKIACNLREAPEEKRLPNRRLQRSVFFVYVSFSDCAAWAAVSSVLPLELFLFTAYISGGGGGVKPVPSRALLSFVAFCYKALCPKVLVSCAVKLLVFFGVSNIAAHGSH